MEKRTSNQEPRIEDAHEAATDTRASMAEKLEVLEGRVRETLKDTRSAVEGIVENVKGTVGDTVGTVKETVDQARSTVGSLVENVKDTVGSTTTTVRQSFDVEYQVGQRPWLMFGGAVLAGYVIGGWTDRDSEHGRRYSEQGASYDDDDNLYAAAMSSGATPEDIEEQKSDTENGHAYPSHMSETAQGQSRSGTHAYEQHQPQESMLGQFHEEWNVLKSVALGTLLGTVRAIVRQQLPTLAPQIDNVLNRMSAKLGAEPIDLWDAQAHSQDREQPNDSGHYSADKSSTKATHASTSVSQESADRTPATNAQPQPYSQYRR
jgi:uncharacterized protein YjbJ (UPF0337 family)